MGFESVLAQELKKLGYTTMKVCDGKVEFEAEIDDICRTNLWLRTAGRVYVKMAEFTATTFDELYEQTKMLPWEEWIQKEDQFPVTQVTTKKSKLYSKSSCQSIVKKAIVDRLQHVYKIPHLRESGALFSIRIQIDKDIVILSINT